MNTGDARVSTDDQNLELRRNALTAAGCAQVFEDKLFGIALRGLGLHLAFERLGAGDILVVWRLDRLGRSLPHLIETSRLIGDRRSDFAP